MDRASAACRPTPNGRFRFTTIKPGRVPAPGGGLQAPHINVTIFMRGMLRQLVTRIYFPGDPANDRGCRCCRASPPSGARTLVANARSGKPSALVWNVRLQGDGETVFFDVLSNPMHTAPVAGTDLHYRMDGTRGAPVLVLSNSLGTDHAMWEPQMAALTPHFCVVRYDTRGHGASGVTPGPYTIEQLGRDVVALLDHLGTERASFCGLSLGGMTGMWLGVHAPRAHRQARARQHRRAHRARPTCGTSASRK